MCGIVGIVAQDNVAPLLLEGLRRLEYRGYDSAGLAIQASDSTLHRIRRVGPVQQLSKALDGSGIAGKAGIAHTRWATHGAPNENNAHPHMSGENIAIVHNGIVENAVALRVTLHAAGYAFSSQTDSEVIAHLIDRKCRQTDGTIATVATSARCIQAALDELEGQFAVAVVMARHPGVIFASRRGCPLIIGRCPSLHLVASDAAALIGHTRDLIDLQDGDLAILSSDSIVIRDAGGRRIKRKSRVSRLNSEMVDLNGYRHFMRKEIFEQPDAIRRTLRGRVTPDGLNDDTFDSTAQALLEKTRCVHFVACGTSYHAAMLVRYLAERITGIPCLAEQASEYRYRRPAVPPGTLLVTISQSGETADTLAVLRMAQGSRGHSAYCGTLSVCNVPDSTLARESDSVLMTYAGPEIGVASTKAFTTQLAALTCIVLALARFNAATDFTEKTICSELACLPTLISKGLELESKVEPIAKFLSTHQHALFMARGMQYPIALEAALKLKEISYIHADAYPAGELKHGPLALVDHRMPVIALAPVDTLYEKVRSNIQEVDARGGKLIILTDEGTNIGELNNPRILAIPRHNSSFLDPYLYTVPLQLLAYHTAIILGTDVDKPRNLAKSVTVE
jgi:glucosamine--fructose-6-phosphate aminotransferase (isomerizing)